MHIRKQQEASQPRYVENILTSRAADAPGIDVATIAEPDAVFQIAETTDQASAPPRAAEGEDDDRSTLLRYQEWTREQMQRVKCLMLAEAVLLAAAMGATFYTSTRWPFIVWAVAEISRLFNGATACRCLRRKLYWLQMDLADGTVCESVGHVQAFRVFWRVVRDDNTHAKYLIVAPFIRPSGVSPGTQVIFRAALRSRLVLSLRRQSLAPASF